MNTFDEILLLAPCVNLTVKSKPAQKLIWKRVISMVQEYGVALHACKSARDLQVRFLFKTDTGILHI